MSDPYFSNVQLLLHFDGTNGSTTFVDSSNSARSVVTYGVISDPNNYLAAAYSLSTASAAFGASSLIGQYYNDGSDPPFYYQSEVSSQGTGLPIPSGDFTVELFFYGSFCNIEFSEWNGAQGVQGTIVAVSTTGTSLSTYTNVHYSGVSVLGTSSTAPNASGWNYIAFQRSGSTTSIYLNSGSPVISTTSALIVGTASGSWTIGRLTSSATYGLAVTAGNPSVNSQTAAPYLDELRYTVGTARYSGSITTPTAAFPPPLVVPITSSPITITPGTVNLASGSATVASLSGAGQTIAITPGTVGFAPSPVVTLSGFPIAVTPGTVGRGYPVTTLSAIVSAAGTIPTIAVATAPLAGAGITVAPGGVGATTPTNVSVPLTSGTGITVKIGTPVAVNLTALLATISGALPAITGSIYISVTVANYFTVSGALPVISGNIYASTNSTTFVISGAIPAITSRWGYISGALPPFIAILETQAVFNGQVTYAMNIKTGETTQYANYNFLSVIRIGFNYYGVRSDGVYLLGGAYDITAPIPTSFTTAQSTLGSTSIKYVPFLYLDAQNPCMVTQITDNETAGPFYSHPTGLKTKLSRGIKGKIWQFKVNNVQGNQFRIGALEALSEITSHRVK